MRVVVDASAVLAVILGESEKESIIEATQGASLVAPEALPFEIGNALTALTRRGCLDRASVLEAWDLVQRVPIQLVSVEMPAALDLALEHEIYAYDAYYLHSASVSRSLLLTLDKKMRRIAKDLDVELLDLNL